MLFVLQGLTFLVLRSEKQTFFGRFFCPYPLHSSRIRTAFKQPLSWKYGRKKAHEPHHYVSHSSSFDFPLHKAPIIYFLLSLQRVAFCILSRVFGCNQWKRQDEVSMCVYSILTGSSLMPQGVPALWSSWLKCPGPCPGPSFSVTFSS